MFNLIINPSYNCNMQCTFCKNRKDREAYKNSILPIEFVEDALNNLDIGSITISGGEPTLLSYDYLYALMTKIREKFKGKVMFETNFLETETCRKLQDAFDINIVVGWDFHIRPLAQKVWNNMYDYQKPFDMKICVTPFILKTCHPNLIIRKLSVLKNLRNLEVVRYIKNENNQWNVTDYIYEEFVKRFITTGFTTNFTFLNKEKVKDNTFLFKDLYLQSNGKLEYYGVDETIAEFKPFDGVVPDMPDEYLTYCNNLVKYMKAL